MHQRERAGQPERGVVDETVERTELFAQVANQLGDVVELAEIERHERKCPPPFLLGVRNRRCDLLALAARERDGLIAGGAKLLRDSEAEPAAAAGDEHAARRL